LWCCHDLGHGRSRHFDILRMLLGIIFLPTDFSTTKAKPGPPPNPSILQLILLAASGRVQILRPISFTAATDGRQSTSSGHASHEAPAFAFPPPAQQDQSEVPVLEHTLNTYEDCSPLRLRARLPRSSLPIEAATIARPHAFLRTLPGSSHQFQGRARFRRPGQTRLPNLKKPRNWFYTEEYRASRSGRRGTVPSNTQGLYVVHHAMPRTNSVSLSHLSLLILSANA
jgi:hypothetical protein